MRPEIYGDDSFQAIDCTGTDNQTTTESNPNTNKLDLVNMQKHKTKKNSSPVRTAHISVYMIVHNCVTQYSTEQCW